MPEREPRPAGAARPGRSRTWIYLLVVLVVGAGLAYALDAAQLSLKINPRWLQIAHGLVVLLAGIVIANLIERHLLQLGSRRLGARRFAMARFFARLLLYVAVLLAVLAAFGVSVGSLAVGGAFLTVVLGLAGQTFFGNLIAGIGLIMWRPFEVGDTISFVAWQFPIQPPTYPHEIVRPYYTGLVTDINIMYTVLQTDDGLSMTVPNGIIIVSAVVNRSRTKRQRLRLRFDVPAAVPPDALIQQIQEVLAHTDHVLSTPTPSVEMADLALVSYAVVVSFWSDGAEESVKGTVLRQIWSYLQTTTSGPQPGA
ncbi:MAG: mechanosensitive ion channel family protein [Sulfobacillus sp.]